MDKERSIRLRFSPDEFDRLDDKRHSERTSFQEVGERLLRGWLAGETLPSEPFGPLTRDEERLLRAVLRYWREGPDSDVYKRALPGLVKLWGPK